MTLEDDYIESVWWSLRRIWDQGRLYEGHKVVPYCPRCGTALSSHEVALGYRDVEDPSVFVRFPVREPGAGGPLEERRLAARLDDYAVDADLQRGASPSAPRSSTRAPGSATRCSCWPPTWSSGCSASGREVLGRMPGSALAGHSLRAAVRVRRPSSGRAGHTVLEADFVTTEEGTGLVHTAIAFGEDDFRLGEQLRDRRCRTRSSPTAPSTSGSADFAGRFVKDADPEIVEALRSSGRLLRSETYEHSYPALLALRDAAALLREVELVHPHDRGPRPDAGRQRGDRLAPRAHQARALRQVAREQRRLGALARALLGHAAADLGVRRAPDCEGAFCAGSIAELRERGGEVPDDLHRPYIDDVVLRCEACGGEMRRVPEVIDAWFDSGSMPFAQFHYPFENGGGVRGALSGRLHLRGASTRPAAGSTRCSPVSTLVFDRAQLPQLRLPRPDPRPRGAEDVEEPRQRGRSVGGDRRPRRRRVPLVLPDLPAALGRLPLLGRDGRRVGAPVPAHALEHVLVLGPVRERGGDRARRSRRRRSLVATAAAGAGPLGAVAAAGRRWER